MEESLDIKKMIKRNIDILKDQLKNTSTSDEPF